MSSAWKTGFPGAPMSYLRSAALRLALCAVLLGACSRAETPKVTQVVVMLRLASDTAALPLMRALTGAYTNAHPNINFTLQSGNAQTAAGMVFDQQVDMAAVSLLPPDVPGRDK